MQRIVRPAADDRLAPVPHTAPQQDQPLEQSQTWVLFSPVTETSASGVSEATPSIQTAGRSRQSDLGSLHTLPGSEQLHTNPSVIDEEEAAEDDAELDSLDSHLPSFRSLPIVNDSVYYDGQPSTTVLPGHDGLGSFHVDNPISGANAQEHLYQFERFNPQRVRRRRESLDQGQVELESEHVRELEKRERIEAWRLEHSRVLLEEIQRETKRRKRSQASLKHIQNMQTSYPGPRSPTDIESDQMSWHDEEAIISEEDSPGLLAKFTQRVIKDLLGIDDRLLSILIGETMPDDDDLSSTPRASQILNKTAAQDSSLWQVPILEKVSKELGMLVNRLSHHPGAFSAYSRMQQMPLPYAGLPAIPESSAAPTADVTVASQPDKQSQPEFQPSSRAMDTSSQQPPPPPPSSGDDVSMGNTFTKDEWEQDLDINLVFRYIKSRFTSRSNNMPSSSSAHLATSTTQDTAAKAARVRQHHPLISRTRPPIERRAFKITTPSSPVAMRHHGSCASQSSRRSARRSSVSSRHYWDIGGSLGTGSVITPNGPMGSWGEV
ncbi:hypothetical protein N3K66_004682 [Trichothecium roseum]|uniref:Uncharacterized protein n=1 Tax=Trichothecium roseum TaxID=47278 RepID=A0ACC0V1Z3_9HYPO|nr:hypothetical protein N3K66_004682 [Trichothecium roseum]